MAATDQRPVLIAGGGIGGLATAMGLAQKGIRSEVLDEVVRLVDAKLEANRRAAADAGVKEPQRAKRSA